MFNIKVRHQSKLTGTSPILNLAGMGTTTLWAPPSKWSLSPTRNKPAKQPTSPFKKMVSHIYLKRLTQPAVDWNVDRSTFKRRQSPGEGAQIKKNLTFRKANLKCFCLCHHEGRSNDAAGISHMNKITVFYGPQSQRQGNNRRQASIWVKNLPLIHLPPSLEAAGDAARCIHCVVMQVTVRAARCKEPGA